MTLGIWYGYRSIVSTIKREGIGRYSLNLAKAMLKTSDVSIELWVYDKNREYIEDLFSEVIAAYPGRIHIYTEFMRLDRYGNYLELIAAAFKTLIGNFGHINENWKRIAASKLYGLPGSKLSIKFSNALLKTITIFMRAEERAFGWEKHIVRGRKKLIVSLVLLYIAMISGILVFSGPLGEVANIAVPLAIGVFYVFLFVIGILAMAIRRLRDNQDSSPTLVDLANSRSEADAFLIPIYVVDDGFLLKKPKVIALHDFIHIQFREEFKRWYKNSDVDAYIDKWKNVLEKYAENDTRFVCNSEFVRDSHLFKILPNLQRQKSSVIYLPTIVPEINKEMSKRLQEALSGREYIFYPTQFRPYKNAVTMVKAWGRLVRAGVDLDLVVTGDIESDEAAMAVVKRENLRQRLVMLSDISDSDLYAAYREARMVVVPTLFEGGFPWQAMEAMACSVPVAMADIPVVRERLKVCGIEKSDDLLLFEPFDYNTLEGHMKTALSSRDIIVEAQHAIYMKINEYSWEDCAREYQKVFFGSRRF